MANMDNLEETQKEKQQWLACDPVTLVTAARQELYETHESAASSPIEEVISRFEQQTRAAIGGAGFTTGHMKR